MATQTTQAASQVEAIKATVEKVNHAGNQALKEGVDKTLNALNEVNALSKGNIEAVVESLTAATKGAEAIGTQTVAFTKKHWDETVSHAKTLSSTKSVQELVELQTKFAKTSLESYVSEFNKFSETVQNAFKDSYKPINARVTATVEKFQSLR